MKSSPRASNSHFLDLAPIEGGYWGRGERSSKVKGAIPMSCNEVRRGVRCRRHGSWWSIVQGTFWEHFTFHYLAGQGALQGVKPERVSRIRG